nr:MAG TPA: hypothetical protein [Caudoviricetes sp.]
MWLCLVFHHGGSVEPLPPTPLVMRYKSVS